MVVMKLKVENARQLGGYYTTDGRKVKSNMLFRSAKLAKATVRL